MAKKLVAPPPPEKSNRFPEEILRKNEDWIYLFKEPRVKELVDTLACWGVDK
jgi:hypothetical protein